MTEDTETQVNEGDWWLLLCFTITIISANITFVVRNTLKWLPHDLHRNWWSVNLQQLQPRLMKVWWMWQVRFKEPETLKLFWTLSPAFTIICLLSFLASHTLYQLEAINILSLWVLVYRLMSSTVFCVCFDNQYAAKGKPLWVTMLHWLTRN